MYVTTAVSTVNTQSKVPPSSLGGDDDDGIGWQVGRCHQIHDAGHKRCRGGRKTDKNSSRLIQVWLRRRSATTFLQLAKITCLKKVTPRLYI